MDLMTLVNEISEAQSKGWRIERCPHTDDATEPEDLHAIHLRRGHLERLSRLYLCCKNCATRLARGIKAV